MSAGSNTTSHHAVHKQLTAQKVRAALYASFGVPKPAKFFLNNPIHLLRLSED
jgi:hypothetical protein